MSFIVISDTHLHDWSAFSHTNEDGVNSRLVEIMDAIEQAAEFQYVCRQTDSDMSDTIYHGGDLFHVRGSLKPSVLNYVKKRLLAINEKYRTRFRIIAGNHDLESNDSNDLGNAAESLSELEFVEIVSSHKTFKHDKVAMLPWRDSMANLKSDLAATAEFLGKERSEWTAIIHAPVNGVILGIPDHGFDGAELMEYGFGLVLSGHYHNFKEVAPGVYSIGALTHQTWGDVKSKAGFLYVDLESEKVDSIDTHAPKFVDYDPEDENQVAGNYVRVKLGESSETEIRAVREHIEGLGARGVVVQATPKPPVATRSGATVETGKSLLGSIESWLGEQEGEFDREQALRDCEAVLAQIED